MSNNSGMLEDTVALIDALGRCPRCNQRALRLRRQIVVTRLRRVPRLLADRDRLYRAGGVRPGSRAGRYVQRP